MRTSVFLKVAALVMPLLLTACGTKKKVVEEQPLTPAQQQEAQQQKDFLGKVSDNGQTAKFITSKVKFTVEVGQQDITLTGNLRMKRDDVIRLQLMAFGFVEAARVEFTKDYVLIMDRINKQYLMSPYVQIDFLRNSGLNFYSLQALFWNELFQPNRSSVSEEDMKKFHTQTDNGDVIISLEDGKMTYSWLAGEKEGNIRMANILYKDRFTGSSQLNWDYQNFERVGVTNKRFPMLHNMALTTTDNKEVKLSMQLSYIGNETEWETRTVVSNKYREVTVDEILKRFMAL